MKPGTVFCYTLAVFTVCAATIDHIHEQSSKALVSAILAACFAALGAHHERRSE